MATTRRFRVRSRIEAADGVVRLALEPTDGAPLDPWRPGAHIDLCGQGDLIRQYSLCGDPDADAYEVAVLQVPEGRGGSNWVHDTLVEGAEVDVAGPRNNFELESSDRYLFVAGGIGITPLLPMVRAVAARGADYEFVYGGRTRRSMAFADDLVGEFGDRVRLVPAEEHGLLDLPTILGEEVPGRRVYSCGPEPLLAALEELMATRAGETLHLERFSPKEPVDTGGDAFDVEIASTGATVRVEEGQSIIEALATVGVDVDFSCQEGTCGTCETGVLGGVPDHRDSVLTAEEQQENDCMMICVGRCRQGPLVLDL